MLKKITLFLFIALLSVCFVGFAGCKPNVGLDPIVVTNSDGSKTTTVTNKDGVTVITTEYKDGSKKTQTNNSDGTVKVVTENVDGSSVSVIMDANGNSVTVTTDKDGNTTTVKVVKHSDGTTLTITEKSDGTKTEVILDADGNVVKNETDAEKDDKDKEQNSLVTSEDGKTVIEIKNDDGSIVKITLDADGNSETVTKDAEGNTTTVKSEKQPDGSTITTTVNPDGSKNVIKIEADGSIIQTPANVPEKDKKEALPVIRITTTNPKDPDDPLAFVTKPISDSVKIHSNSDGNAWGAENLLKPSPWYEDCSVTVQNEFQEILIDDAVARVKVRGNYTTGYDKKGLKIKFDKKKSMLGLHDGNKYKNWVLIASWKDFSFLRDYTAYKMAKLIDSKYYATDCRLVEVYINDSYWGVYLLVEQQESKRVGITEAVEGDGVVETGYLLEYDSYAGIVNNQNIIDDPTLGDDGFDIGWYGDFLDINLEKVSYANTWYTIKSDYDEQKKAFITNYMVKLWEICREAIENHKYLEFDANNKNLIASSAKTPEECISKVVDIDSLVDTFILQEIACDLDLHWSSFYMDLDLNPENPKRLTFEAPWDFDSAFGNHKDRQLGPGKISHLVSVTSNSPCDGNPWTIIFGKEEWFQNKVRAKWAEIKAGDVKGKIIKEINNISNNQVYVDAFFRNYYKWGHAYVDELPSSVQNCKTQKQAAAVIVNFLNKRFEMLDKDFEVFAASNNPITDKDEKYDTYDYTWDDPENKGKSFTDTLKVEAKEDGLHITRIQDSIWNHTSIYVKDETQGVILPWINDIQNADKTDFVYPYVVKNHVYSVWLVSQRSYSTVNEKGENVDSWEGWHSSESKKAKVKATGGIGNIYVEKTNFVVDKANKKISYEYYNPISSDTINLLNEKISIVIFDSKPWSNTNRYDAGLNVDYSNGKAVFTIDDKGFWGNYEHAGITLEYYFRYDDEIDYHYEILSDAIW